MTIKDTSAESYVRRRRLFVDPDERDQGRSPDQFTFVVPLATPLENVVGIELVDYNVRRALAPTFVAREGLFRGNNRVDVEMWDTATTAQRLEFTMEAPQASYTSVAALATALTSLFNAAMDAAGHPFHSTGSGVVWAVTENKSANARGMDGALDFQVQAGGVPDSVAAVFRFGSGPSVLDSAAEVLGFAAGADAGAGHTAGLVPVPTHRPTLQPFRYVDVLLDDVPELTPVARLFVTDTGAYSRTSENMDGLRVLERPLRKLDELRVRLRLSDGRRPSMLVGSGVDLVFDAYTLSPEVLVPDWVEQARAF